MPERTVQWRAAISVVILACFAAWLASYVYDHLDAFRGIADVPARKVFGLIGVLILLTMCSGLFMRDILVAYSVHMKPVTWISLAFVTAFINLVLPMRGGAAFRAAYLKGSYQLSLSSFASSLSAMFLIFISMHGVLGLLAMGFMSYKGQPTSPLVSVFLLVVTATSFSPVLFRLSLPDYSVFHLQQISSVVNGWNKLRDNRALCVRLYVDATLFALITLVQYKLAFSVYDVDLSWSQLTMFVAVRNLATLATITPGALGIVEGLAAYMGSSLGYTVSQALMVQVLIRVVAIVVLASAFLPSLRCLGRDYRSVFSVSDSSRKQVLNEQQK